MSSPAELAHQELLSALDAFTNAQDHQYQPTIDHAMQAVLSFLPLLTATDAGDLSQQIDLALSLPIVADQPELVNLFSNLRLYHQEYYDAKKETLLAKEALLILSLCNEILSQLIPLIQEQPQP
ncbi:hypothetical protein [Entomospira culicis]|uniref:Uncharacterized protein n=1 Tax=Entomospira culicis TaxID=2719989 RepID=A0A968GGT4_9SPIO|nr:hypothetical protein [Entomospira culicis]NIZ19287.1 hypothetical protein [Entomospira culicis]NIZ69808.1 hypothetical protein [Entomospira culicis]WDI36917.1 hypothetical protein PVA46_06225 [Entomospira culicis]WDI38546.1 hypothetical protein PVA47_06235 [Entomospira culicis]